MLNISLCLLIQQRRSDEDVLRVDSVELAGSHLRQLFDQSFIQEMLVDEIIFRAIHREKGDSGEIGQREYGNIGFDELEHI